MSMASLFNKPFFCLLLYPRERPGFHSAETYDPIVFPGLMICHRMNYPFHLLCIGSSFSFTVPGWTNVANWSVNNRGMAIGVLPPAIGAGGIARIVHSANDHCDWDMGDRNL